MYLRESDADSDPLLDRVLNHINENAKVIGEAVLELYRPTLAKLDAAIGEALLLEEATFTPSPGGFAAAQTRHPLVQLKKRLLRYIRQAPVVGFNSGRYDLNLIKIRLHSFFASGVRRNQQFSVIKRSNQYLTVYTQFSWT